jgi:predicted lipid-binding transport protein (Tim44 family)
MSAGNTAVQAPMAYPYLQSGQLDGLLGGMAGGAELEKLTGFTDKATTFIKSQSFAHVVVILFIVIGNIAFFRDRGRGVKK